jgi:hypothetical protein
LQFFFLERGYPMVSKCANPDCGKPFKYLRDGKVIRLEVADLTSSAKQRSHKRVEHFWLCGECSQTMTIKFDTHNHVQVMPREVALYRRAAAAAS